MAFTAAITTILVGYRLGVTRWVDASPWLESAGVLAAALGAHLTASERPPWLGKTGPSMRGLLLGLAAVAPMLLVARPLESTEALVRPPLLLEVKYQERSAPFPHHLVRGPCGATPLPCVQGWNDPTLLYDWQLCRPERGLGGGFCRRPWRGDML
jgi:hypothetical protein